MYVLMILSWCGVIVFFGYCFFFKQKTAYEMRISDWSSDVCSSDLGAAADAVKPPFFSASPTATWCKLSAAPPLARTRIAARPGTKTAVAGGAMQLDRKSGV